jgi:NAD(P)-dependent dehydrogenase (short-subunit alcohol dehydrogenase family)
MSIEKRSVPRLGHAAGLGTFFSQANCKENVTMQKGQKPRPVNPAQSQGKQPGIEAEMDPKPEFMPENPVSGRLRDKIAIITGGDSGIGRAVAVLFAQEGANVVISYLNEHQDAEETQQIVENLGQQCLLISGDISNERHCRQIVTKTIDRFGRIDIVVNNAAVQYPQKSITDISAEQLQKTFATNIFAMFYLVKAALPHLKAGASIINTTSVTAYRGSAELLDYASTKGAIVAFTRSLAGALAKDKIRVNAVAPGPIWTPLIPATFPPKKVAKFGSDTPMGRPGQPEEVAPAYLFLAGDDGTYFTGQVLHPNGGEIVNG